MHRPSHLLSKRAFSLIEVTIALGITTFCLVPIIGMLPVGLRSLKNANEQAGAAAVVSQIATAIRNASTDANGTVYTNTFGGTDSPKQISYSIGGGQSTPNLGALTLGGTPATNTFEERFKTQVTIIPPNAGDPLGTAIISVAWPAAANPTWNASTNQWDNKASGSVTTAVKFLPRS